MAPRARQGDIDVEGVGCSIKVTIPSSRDLINEHQVLLTAVRRGPQKLRMNTRSIEEDGYNSRNNTQPSIVKSPRLIRPILATPRPVKIVL